MGSGGDGKKLDVNNVVSSLTLGLTGTAANQGLSGEDVKNRVNTGVNNVVGEVTGGNADRQAAWQKQVASDAEAQRLKQIADRNLAAQNLDVASSNSARGKIDASNAAAKRGSSFNWNPPSNSDTTDFLGL